jgi:hypothetical protein
VPESLIVSRRGSWSEVLTADHQIHCLLSSHQVLQCRVDSCNDPSGQNLDCWKNLHANVVNPRRLEKLLMVTVEEMGDGVKVFD